MDREDSEVSQRTCSPLTSAGVEHCEKLEEAAVMAYAPQWSPRVSPHGGVFTQQQLKSQESLESDCNYYKNIPKFKEHQSIVAKNEVDSWIEQLDPSKGGNPKPSGVNQEFLMTWLIQQHLPKVELPKFGGEPLEWVEFIVKFRDIVHDQYYLTDCQRLQLLLQHLTGEAKRSVKGYSNDRGGYVMSLKKLKYLFGQRPRIAQAVLDKVTKGKAILNGDVKELTELSYSINDCMVSLSQLNYEADLRSSDTLRQVVRRLPPNMLGRWAEHSLAIRQYEEPNLSHLNSWLQDRVLALKEAYLPSNRQQGRREEKFTGITSTGVKVQGKRRCELCDDSHQFWKCKKYRETAPRERMEMVKKWKLCFNCFQDKHQIKNCTSKNTCFRHGCKEKHHTTLHDYFLEKRTSGENKNDNRNNEIFHALTGTSPRSIYLQIVPVKVHGKGNETFDTYALLDSGSQSTLIRDDVAKRLGLKGKRKFIRIATVKDQAESIQVEEFGVKVSSRDGEYHVAIDSVYATPAKKFNMPSRPRCSEWKGNDSYSEFESISTEAINPEEITMLIGANVPEALLYTDVRHGNKGQPMAVKTKFGWTLFGASSGRRYEKKCAAIPRDVSDTSCEEVSVLCSASQEKKENWDEKYVDQVDQDNQERRSGEELNKSLERFWVQEHQGIVAQRDCLMSTEDKIASINLEENTKFLGERYEVPMLWSNPDVTLPNNVTMARKRYSFLEKRLRANETLYKGFKAVIDGYLQQDPPVARKLSPKEAGKTGPRTWYLPMHPVTNPNKPGKIRVVNDAAALFEGTSLNNVLLTGPDLLNSLVGILIRFRTGKVAVAADVKDHFHRVRVNSEDADSLRFLWKDDISSAGPPDTYQMLVHIFGAKDSPACANYALKRIARDNAEKFGSSAYETVMRNFYVDDMLKSVNSEEDAISLSRDLISMLQSGSFRLTKFLSNSRKVLEALPPEDVSPSAILNIDTEQKERALGVSWNTALDVFTFPTKLKDAPVTKRGILSTTSALFDPLGFLSPFILKAKVLLQELWRLNYEWDEEIEDKMKIHWEKWLEGAKKVSNIKLNRQYIRDDRPISHVQLHVFCDASEIAYGCVAYIRVTFETGEHKCAFVMAKSRLAPIKTITLPRLELNAAQIGARMAHLIVHEIDLPIERVQFWSDSMLTLQYIKNTRNRMKVFVANRVTEILELSTAEQWGHVPGSINPADILSRGILDPEKLAGNWFEGPEFLLEDEENWPNTDVKQLATDDPEVKRKAVLVGMGIEKSKEIDITRFSTWMRLRRVMAWVMRFLRNCRRCKKKIVGCLSLEEISVAESQIMKIVQSEEFDEEIRIVDGNGVLPMSSKLIALNPFLDDEHILRVGGRLQHISIPMDAKHPVILPGSHHVSKLLIEWTHKRNGHVGVEHVLSLLRERYWITGARVAIKTVIRHCFFCKMRRAMRQFPLMANLPPGRAAFDEPPFKHCGTDLFGPILVKEGRKRLKRWVVLFTCLTIRSIHLEVVESTDTDAFINSLRRFVNRRGCPSIIYSDRGSNFRGATSELKEFVTKLMDDAKICDFATTMKIEWRFNPPSAPHMGGVWERLVRSVKEVMTGIMGNYVLTDPQLLTLMTEVESIVNSRPLTHVSENVDDLEALTPNHILLGRHRNWAYVADVKERDVSSRRKYKQVQALSKIFWDRWKREYLPTLIKRPKWRVHKPRFEVGELVLLQDDDVKRGKWPLARITKVMPGKEGVTRVVELRTKNGNYTRPVTKLYKIEDCENDEVDIRNHVRQGGENVAAEEIQRNK